MRKVKGLLGTVVGLMLLFNAGSMVAVADDHGNNGTIKIHETANDNDHEMENDPHVCSFHISGMNFDNNSNGTWWIERWAPSGSGQVMNGAFHADASGYWRTSDMTLADGHYKAFAKQDGTVGGDKQKVFWVDCAQSSTTGGSTTGATTGGNTTGSTTGSTTGGSTTGGSTTGGSTTGGSTTGGSTTGATTGGNTTGSTTGATTGGSTTGATTGGSTTGGATTGGATTGGATTGGTEGATTGGTTGGQGNVTGGETSASPISGTTAGAAANVGVNGETAASGVSPNVAILPSTSTGGQSVPLAALGAFIVGIGAFLIRSRVSAMR